MPLKQTCLELDTVTEQVVLHCSRRRSNLAVDLLFPGFHYAAVASARMRVWESIGTHLYGYRESLLGAVFSMFGARPC